MIDPKTVTNYSLEVTFFVLNGFSFDDLKCGKQHVACFVLSEAATSAYRREQLETGRTPCGCPSANLQH
jgi:hypothetical protein